MNLHDAIRAGRTETLGERIKLQRQKLGLTQSELAFLSRINQGYISEIERNKVAPRPATVTALALALNMPEGVLVGEGLEHDAPLPLDTRELPLLGSIPAGPPAETQEETEMFPVLRHHYSTEYYCLRLSWDSMEPTLKPGDIVLVHYRPDVDPEHVQGKICACLVDGQPTLKRVSVESQAQRKVVILRGDNPRVPPMLIDDSREFSIQGIVLQLVSREL